MESVLLPPNPSSPTEARAFTRRLLRSWRVASHIIEDAELLVTEVVTNAVIHAGTSIRLVISRASDEIRFDVTDRGEGGVEMRVPSPRASTGRGLFLVNQLASHWRADRESEGGTTVRFSLPFVVEQEVHGRAGAN